MGTVIYVLLIAALYLGFVLRASESWNVRSNRRLRGRTQAVRESSWHTETLRPLQLVAYLIAVLVAACIYAFASDHLLDANALILQGILLGLLISVLYLRWLSRRAPHAQLLIEAGAVMTPAWILWAVLLLRALNMGFDDSPVERVPVSKPSVSAIQGAGRLRTMTYWFHFTTDDPRLRPLSRMRLSRHDYERINHALIEQPNDTGAVVLLHAGALGHDWIEVE